MSEKTFQQIVELLDNNKTQYKTFEHAPVRTSEEASKVRGVPLHSGAKAMIVRSESKFYEFILGAHKRLDLNAVKRILNTRSASLASRDEVLEVTDCVPGSVPPFGNLWNIPVYADNSLSETINFNAGLLEKSVQMFLKDWKRIVKPIEESFSESETSLN